MLSAFKKEKTKLANAELIASSESGSLSSSLFLQLLKYGDLYAITGENFFGTSGINYNSYNLSRSQSYFLFLKTTVGMLAIDRFVTRTGEIDMDGQIIPVNQIEVFFGDKLTTVINVYKNERGLFEMVVKLLDCILNDIDFKVFTDNGVEILNKYKRGEVVLDNYN